MFEQGKDSVIILESRQYIQYSTCSILSQSEDAMTLLYPAEFSRSLNKIDEAQVKRTTYKYETESS